MQRAQRPFRFIWVGMILLTGSVETLAAPFTHPGFTNAPWSDPNFFPIGVWLQVPENAARYRAAGINTYVGLWDGPKPGQLETLQQAGMFVICGQTSLALERQNQSSIIGWHQLDEPDNARRRGARLGWGHPTPPTEILATYQQWQQADPTRPVFLGLGQGVAWDGWYGRGTRNNRPEDYPEYVQGGDILSFNIYPVNHDRPEITGNLWIGADGVKRLCQWAGGTKPVWNCIETTRIETTGRKPTPTEVRAQVWMSLIHGSRGLIYFVHQFTPTFVEAGLLADAEMLAAVTAINREITELAPVLNSPSGTNQVHVRTFNSAAPVATMTKQHGPFTYVFAVAMRPLTTEVEFTSANFLNATTVEVIGESRTRSMLQGKFTDTFAPYEVHLYRIENSPAR
jgi:hypothetical protein